jgi:hypothetical protein
LIIIEISIQRIKISGAISNRYLPVRVREE